jgi:hypothetical protein
LFFGCIFVSADKIDALLDVPILANDVGMVLGHVAGPCKRNWLEPIKRACSRSGKELRSRGLWGLPLLLKMKGGFLSLQFSIEKGPRTRNLFLEVNQGIIKRVLAEKATVY